MAGGMCGQGACMAGGACVAGETATAVDSTHPTRKHCCFLKYLLNLVTIKIPDVY